MSLLRLVTRLIGAVWMLVLALFGLAVALYCFDAIVRIGSARPDRLLRLPAVRRHVGWFLGQVAAPGSTAGLALLCGLGAVLIGIILLIGILGRRRRRLAVLEQDSQTGTIAARPRPLRDMARALAQPARVAATVKRPKLSLSGRGTRGKLTVNATRGRTTNPTELQAALQTAVQPITEPFHLTLRVRIQPSESGNRTQ